MNLTRRALLQQTSLALASVGLSQIGLSHLTRRYQEVLATPTSRKLALLIGINQYADEVCGFSDAKGTILQGAVTDVNLHRELLIARFGFHPSDIVTLKDQQATRDGIETALQFHLLDQVKDGDIVVVHFSGLGSLVRLQLEQDSDSPIDDSLPLHKTLVPVDGTLPNSENAELNDFMQATLADCLRALPTQKIVSLLDVGYQASSPLLGNLRVRSRLNSLDGVVLRNNSALRRRLSKRTKKPLTVNDLVTQQPQFPGVLVSGANDQGIATEATWDGFSSGVLTYSLMQHLWHATPTTSIYTSLGQTRREIEQWVGHQPTISGMAKADKSPQIPAYVNLAPTAFAAEGVVLNNNLEKGSLELWLGGLSPLVLEYCGDSCFLECFITSALPDSTPGDTSSANHEDKFVLLQGRSRKGLRVIAQPVTPSPSVSIDNISAGHLIREKIRTIPKDVRLVVALDHDLERIERVDATSALSAIPKMTSSVAGEQYADCVFGKVRPSDIPAPIQEDTSVPKDISSDTDSENDNEGNPIRRMYGIFRPGHSLITSTLSQDEEAVKTSIHRVEPQLQGLLATKLLQLTENQASSRLGIEISLDTHATSDKAMIVQKAARSQGVPANSPASKWVDDGTIPQVQIGDRIYYRFNNYGDRPLYCLFISIDSRGNITALYPSSSRASKIDTSPTVEEANVIPANTMLALPKSEGPRPWTINGPIGRMTTYVILSCAPFTNTIASLPQLKSKQPLDDSYTMIPLTQPLKVAQAILQDLHDASWPHVEQLALELPSDHYSLDLSYWGTFNFTYDVVKPALQV